MDIKRLIQNYLDRDILCFDDIMGSGTEDVMQTIIGKVHKYAIMQTPDGRYTTYVPDGSKPNGRRQIRRKSKTDLYRALLEFYDIAPDDCTLTVEEAFEQYLDYKEQFCEAENPEYRIKPQTLRRYENDFVKYIKDTDFGMHKIGNMKKAKLENLLSEMVQKNGMTKRCAKNVLLNVQQVFRHAWEQELIAYNPAERINKRKIMALSKYVPPKPDEEQVLLIPQIIALLDVLHAHQNIKPDYLPDYAAELTLLAGMRVGEPATLHWSDIDDDYINIDYSEHSERYRRKHNKQTEITVGEPKNRKHRKIPLTPEMRNVLDRVRAVGHHSKDDYIFVRKNGTRYTEGALAAALKRRAAEAGLSGVTYTRIRKTVSSMLNGELPQMTVSAIMGHTPPVNQGHYNFDAVEYREKSRALAAVSSKVINFRASNLPHKKAESG